MQHIDALKKENFSIKLKVHFLEERLAQLAPDQIDAALKQNINLKIEVQQRGLEMKKYKKLVLELERELERLQSGSKREKELEEKLEQRERRLQERYAELDVEACVLCVSPNLVVIDGIVPTDQSLPSACIHSVGEQHLDL